MEPSEGTHHMHRRKRVHVHHQEYPHPDKWKRRLDKTMCFLGMVGPIMTIPQLWTIWIVKQSEGVSAITWSAYLFVASFWLLYGIVHKEKAIILVNTTWIFLDILIIVGVLLY